MPRRSGAAGGRGDSRRATWPLALGCVISLSVMSACTEEPSTPLLPPSIPSRSASATPLPNETSSAAKRPIANDLKKTPLVRKLDAGPLTLTVKYTTKLPVKEWTSGIGKPIKVSLTAVNRRKSRQKIYLTKATVNLTAFDDVGPVDTPRAISDTTDINPGFIVTSPNTYNQTFTLPAVDDTAVRLTIDFTYEFAQQVDKDKDGRNFAKQVATDTITVPVAQS